MRGLLVVLVLVLTLGACGAKQQTLNLTNRTPRTIVEVYVYPLGSANHGSSRGTLPPEGTLSLKVPIGHLEVRAVSERVQVDDKQGETREATSAVQLNKAPVELIFHDSNQKPPGLERPNTLGVVFRVEPPPAKTEEPSEQTVEPSSPQAAP